MNLAKPNENDLNGALDVAQILGELSSGWFPSNDSDEDMQFDIDDAHDCQKALSMLIDIEKKCHLMRAAMTALVLCDENNKVIDPSSDIVDHHPDVKAAVELKAKIDSFFTQKFTSGMKFQTRDGATHEMVSVDFEEGLVAYSDENLEGFQWVRWENVTLIEDQEAV